MPNSPGFSVTISLLETFIGDIIENPLPLYSLPPQGEDEVILREWLETSPLFSVWETCRLPQMTAKPLTLSSVANDQNFFLNCHGPKVPS